jgi:DNA-3-methyladenine glycosylase I
VAESPWPDTRLRCDWLPLRALDDAMVVYHDTEWGVPQHDDRALFEMLTLGGAQAGLSWQTILSRRSGYRRAFADWDYEAVAAFTDADLARLLNDPGIIRNRAKVNSAIGNARALLAVREGFGSFDAYIWRFVDGATKVNGFEDMTHLPAETPESAAMSKELQKRGFRFVGPTICYAFMQAAGLINDHVRSCFRYADLTK